MPSPLRGKPSALEKRLAMSLRWSLALASKRWQKPPSSSARTKCFWQMMPPWLITALKPYATTLSKLAAERTPDLLLFPTTTRGRELAGMVAIDLKTGVMVDVTALEASGDKITVTRPIYAGKLLTKETCSSKPQIITLRGRAFPKPAQQAGKSGTLTKVPAATGDFPTKVEGYTTSEGRRQPDGCECDRLRRARRLEQPGPHTTGRSG